MTTAKFWKETDSTDLQRHEGIHEGLGVIVRKMFFREKSQLPVRLDIWELPPGASEGSHAHGDRDGRPLEEIYYFLSGSGMMRIAGEDVAVAQGDAIMVPPDVDHGLFNDGTEALRLLLIWGEPQSIGIPSDLGHPAARASGS